MSIAKERFGSYHLGVATFGVLSAIACLLIAALRGKWLQWALPLGKHAALRDLSRPIRTPSDVS